VSISLSGLVENKGLNVDKTVDTPRRKIMFIVSDALVLE